MNRSFDARLRALEALEEAQQPVPPYVVLVPGTHPGEWILPDGSIWYELPDARLVELDDDL